MSRTYKDRNKQFFSLLRVGKKLKFLARTKRNLLMNGFIGNMKLYHATKKKYLKSILKNGLKRKQKHGHWGQGDSTYIYTVKTKKEAKEWGEIILQIDSSGLDLRNFPDENPVWQILIMDDVPINQIKVL